MRKAPDVSCGAQRSISGGQPDSMAPRSVHGSPCEREAGQSPAGHPPGRSRPVTGRPPARGGPTIYDVTVALVEPPYIVGPPLAGGLWRHRWRAGGGIGGVPVAASVACPALALASVTPMEPPLAGGLGAAFS